MSLRMLLLRPFAKATCGLRLHSAEPGSFQYCREIAYHRARRRYVSMLDLGLSFVASVARDPQALAIVDGEVRLSYAEWYRRVSAVVAGFDALGLKPGDHLVTALTNRWEAATLHWACQFAGIIITPVNWRSSASELEFFLGDAEAKALAYEEVSAQAVAGCTATKTLAHRARWRRCLRHSIRRARRALSARCTAAGRCRSVVGDALHLRHHGTSERRAAPAARRTRRGLGARRAKPLRPRRAHARRHAALPHHGGALAACHVAHRRRLRLPAPLRRRARAADDRSRADHEPLPGAYPLPRSRSSSAVRHDRRQLGAQARLCRRADDRWFAEKAASRVQARPVRQPLRLVGNLHLHHRSERAGKTRLGRPLRHQSDGPRGQTRRAVGR